MKFIISAVAAIILASLIPSSALAQWSFGSSNHIISTPSGSFVGIGITSATTPAAKLHVRTSESFPCLALEGSKGAYINFFPYGTFPTMANQGRSGWLGYGDGSDLVIQNNRKPGDIILRADMGDVIVGQPVSGVGGNFYVDHGIIQNKYLTINNNTLNLGNNHSLHLLNNEGDGVYIGSASNPVSLAVNGTVRAREIMVQTAYWPDYVFAPDYKLRSLTDLDAYIKEHQHLPGIPSEQEIVSDGVHIAQMEILLLEKVEELTLYTLRQQQELDELRAVNRELQDQLIELQHNTSK